MIRINLLSAEQKKLAAELLKFEETHRSKPFSQRNPDKKMVKCLYCVEGRHVAPICTPRYAENTSTFTVGRSFVKGRRLAPRPSQRQLLLVLRTRELMPKYELRGLEPINTMKLARAEASRSLRSERKDESKRVRDQQKRSRKINRA
jgi:hypothetical protein